MGVSSGRIYDSPDGREWTQVASGDSHFDVTYAANAFVAVGDISRIWRSTDGTNWTSTNALSRFYGITFGQTKFVTVGDGGGVAVSETFGATWTQVIAATNTTLGQ